MPHNIKYLVFFVLLTISSNSVKSQHSIAREWNEKLLEAIRSDFARPTVHARNLFHSSMLMYDSWAVFEDNVSTVFLGQTFGNFNTQYNALDKPNDKVIATKEVISYGMFRLLSHRFKNSPNVSSTLNNFESFFKSLGYDKDFNSTDYSGGSYAALGNYLAEKIIEFGLQDNSNEVNQYTNQFYLPENEPLLLNSYQSNENINPNKWQPLAFDVFIDQSGNTIPVNTPSFLSPEWGKVTPFSLNKDDLQILNNGFNSYVYYNPGPPNQIQNLNDKGINDPYKWHFSLVISWSAHLDPNDNININISPNAIGNLSINSFPESFEQYKTFYNFDEGGDYSRGHSINPKTKLPYKDNIVKRADYARVLAEFWADGPDSETPPGHWFTILNYVSDHPLSKKTFGNSNVELTKLEWDVKSYLVLGGAMHDAAIATWGIKGYYDYIRPISAIRYMASKGQSSDSSLDNFNPHGLPLINGLIETIKQNDPLIGDNNLNLGKIKVKSWKGPDFINDPNTDVAGVDWILGTHWWPYQRPSFVTPPFAGYLSGHSTFSRAAAEVLTLITNDPFFPGGIGTFNVLKNNFLVFEQGPSRNITLQWATYQDASDQTSLSRIWGGIHPPLDDIKGRLIGDKIGKLAFSHSKKYFDNTLSTENELLQNYFVYPNPFKNSIFINTSQQGNHVQIYNLLGTELYSEFFDSSKFNINTSYLNPGIYIVKIKNKKGNILHSKKLIKIE